MGPYVMRSINSYFKSIEVGVEDSLTEDLEQAPFGISGLETALPLCLDLWRDGVVTLERLVALLTCNPARILGLSAGTLAVGAPGDVAVIDPDLSWVVEPGSLVSRGKNTPFAGRVLRGAATHTVVQGRVVWDHERG